MGYDLQTIVSRSPGQGWRAGGLLASSNQARTVHHSPVLSFHMGFKLPGLFQECGSPRLGAPIPSSPWGHCATGFFFSFSQMTLCRFGSSTLSRSNIWLKEQPHPTTPWQWPQGGPWIWIVIGHLRSLIDANVCRGEAQSRASPTPATPLTGPSILHFTYPCSQGHREHRLLPQDIR